MVNVFCNTFAVQRIRLLLQIHLGFFMYKVAASAKVAFSIIKRKIVLVYVCLVWSYVLVLLNLMGFKYITYMSKTTKIKYTIEKSEQA